MRTRRSVKIGAHSLSLNGNLVMNPLLMRVGATSSDWPSVCLLYQLAKMASHSRPGTRSTHQDVLHQQPTKRPHPITLNAVVGLVTFFGV